MDIRGIIMATKNGVIKHSPEILTGLGTIGLIFAGIMAVGQTPKAMRAIKEHEEQVDQETPLSKSEIVADCWKYYLPSVLLTATSVGCIIFARRIDAKRMAAWVAAYQMSENALVKLQDSVKEEVGEKKLQKIEDKAILKSLEDHPINPEEIINTGEGDELFQDYYSGAYFRSSIDALQAHYNRWISKLQRYDFMDVNSWVHDELGLCPVGDELGGENGFNISQYQKRELEDKPDYVYGPGLNGNPCAVVKLSCSCRPDYMEYN